MLAAGSPAAASECSPCSIYGLPSNQTGPNHLAAASECKQRHGQTRCHDAPCLLLTAAHSCSQLLTAAYSCWLLTAAKHLSLAAYSCRTPVNTRVQARSPTPASSGCGPRTSCTGAACHLFGLAVCMSSLRLSSSHLFGLRRDVGTERFSFGINVRLLGPGGCTAFRSDSNRNALTPPGSGGVAGRRSSSRRRSTAGCCGTPWRR